MIETKTKFINEASVEQLSAIHNACNLIAPSWPLDRFIAVNALWECRHHPIELVSARLGALAGIKTTLSAEELLTSYSKGEISDKSLIAAAEAYNIKTDIKSLKRGLKQASPEVWLSIAEIADLSRDHHKMRWQDETVHQISQFCGEFINHHPDNLESLYSHWLDFTTHDYGMSLLMGEKHLRQAFNALPNNFETLFAEVAAEFELGPYELELYAHKLLLSINGWASYFSWQRWEKTLKGQESQYVESLLAIRMAWDLIVWRQLKSKVANPDFRALAARWSQQKLQINELIDEHVDYLRFFWVWTHAAELEYQKNLHQTLKCSPEPNDKTAQLQAVFCIDVRSERFRRALENQDPAIQTIGFAGFYGLPISYQPVDTPTNRPQLPGLVAPAIKVSEKEANQDNLDKLHTLSHWKGWANSSVSAFTMVETVGWTYAFKLLKDNFFGKKKENWIDSLSHHKDWDLLSNGQPLSLDEKASLVSGVLKGMGLIQEFAPTVLLLGHGSETRNNLHASGLDCGACGGQTGEVNVRVLANLLNDDAIRQKLSEQGIEIPDKTRFVSGLHNTTTDEISCFADVDKEIDSWLKQAANETRGERALLMEPALHNLDDKKLQKALSDKAKDWSEVRPEWGLANNAAFVVAPRQRTRSVPLDGRSFLHDYDWRQDPDSVLLEQIMTAPMVVTHWINMQYNLSVADNDFFGSGNKLLHNAVNQHIGVFEGNGGDLRIGLPFQSIHDGNEWRHQPLRLSVYIAAPKAAIERVIATHETVRQLVDNNWLFLFCWNDDNNIERYHLDYWEHVK
ncbi:MAG: DUF2309 domain-containing protein [Methylophaga sp.]|uniref:YbcC family protein n=1 Tax=Methylophaga sp. TaxID=2024840 RepID=UPI00299EE2BD|nr:DUF2309 domain-containing protein [Methylophaga sp.]MDX1750576.1 DUF2309 domain-containing protein [Methylophaga sp.]